MTNTVFKRAELSKAIAAVMLGAHCIDEQCAFKSCITVVSGPLLETKVTVPTVCRFASIF